MTGAVHAGSDNGTQVAVVEEASRCFQRYGVHRTRMADVADHAGITRNALYRMFPNRQSLIDAVVERHVDELIARMQPLGTACSSFADELVEAGVEVITVVRESSDLLGLAFESAGQASHYLLRPGTVAGKLSQGVWQPIIDRGRQRGEIRSDLTDQDYIEWISTIMLMYGLREDIPLDRIRTLLHDFLLPAALAGAENLGRN